MRCAFCQSLLHYVHGHAACVKSGCPMFGVNQAECCSGDIGGVPTALVAARNPAPEGKNDHED